MAKRSFKSLTEREISALAVFAEALSDDGSLTGWGIYMCAGVIGVTTAAGGVGHTLPFLLPNFHAAFTLAALVVAGGDGDH